MFVSEIDAEKLRGALPNTGITSIDDRKQMYIRVIDTANGPAASWHYKYRQIPFKWMSFVFIIMLYLKEKKYIQNTYLNDVFSFALLFLGTNLIFYSTIPQFGRFYRISLLFMYTLFFAYFSIKRPYWVKKLLVPFVFAALFMIFVETRMAMDSASLDTILSNPILSVLYKSGITAINLIK